MSNRYWGKIFAIGIHCLIVLLSCNYTFAHDLEEVKKLNEQVILFAQDLEEAEKLNKLVIQLYEQGKYQDAIPPAKQALAVREIALGPDHPDVATSLNGLAGLYHALGDYDKAEPLYVRALKIREKALGPDHPDVAICINGLAGLYHALGDYDKAEPLYARALEIYKKALGPDHPYITRSLNDMALLYLEDKRHDEAFKILNQTHNSIVKGKYHLAGYQYSDAVKEFSRSLEVVKKTEEKDSFVAICIGLGSSYEGQRDYKQARAYFQKGIDIIESQWHYLSPSAKKYFIAGRIDAGFSRLDAYEGLMRIILTEKGSPKEALTIVEGLKGKMLLEMLGTSELKGKTKADKEIIQRYREYQKAITILTARLEAQEALAREALAQKAIAGKAPLQERKEINEQIEQIRQSLQEKKQECNRFIDKIRSQNPEIASLISINTPPIEDIQKKLDDDTILIEYYVAKENTYAWLLTRNDIRAFELSSGRDAVKKVINHFFIPVISSGTRRPQPHILKIPTNAYTKKLPSDGLEKNRKQFLKQSTQLYKAIFSPFEKEIKAGRLLIVVPHGILHKLSFAALYDGEKYLIEKHPISYLPSASTILYLKKKGPTFPKRFLAFVNPYEDKNTPYHPPLIHAEKEVEAISSLFKEKKIYKGASATETVFKEKASGFEVIHLANGYSFNERYPFLSCSLFTKDGKNDGHLQLHEVFELDLQDTHLVTLSACETSLSRIYGRDNLVGLSHGFFYAGASSILATLWEIDDKFTALLMERFYRNWLEGMSKPEALRQAQIELKKLPRYAHFFYWAPFVLLGRE